jgi:outer membrane protein OmpA-like peptidoglycan-associated protein
VRPLALLLLLLPALPAAAQLRPFNCVGADLLEDDVFEVPFRAGRERLEEAARTPLSAAAELARAAPERNLCVLGHASREGGQTTSTQLAARRARAVADALSVQYGIERDRIRAEARNPGFSPRTAVRPGRNVSIVVLPAAAP